MQLSRKRNPFTWALLTGSALLLTAITLGAATEVTWPTLTKAVSPGKAPDAQGFIQRWLILEPIPTTGLTSSAVQAAVHKEYFPDQLTVIPHDGDKVTVGNEQLTWYAVDTKLYNVNLYHFARALGKPTSDVLFWAVTIVNSPREMPRCTAGDRLKCRFGVVAQWQRGDRHLRGSPNRDRRRCFQAPHAPERS